MHIDRDALGRIPLIASFEQVLAGVGAPVGGEVGLGVLGVGALLPPVGDAVGAAVGSDEHLDERLPAHLPAEQLLHWVFPAKNLILAPEANLLPGQA